MNRRDVAGVLTAAVIACALNGCSGNKSATPDSAATTVAQSRADTAAVAFGVWPHPNVILLQDAETSRSVALKKPKAYKLRIHMDVPVGTITPDLEEAVTDPDGSKVLGLIWASIQNTATDVSLRTLKFALGCDERACAYDVGSIIPHAISMAPSIGNCYPARVANGETRRGCMSSRNTEGRS